jgi:hypothetical protein
MTTARHSIAARRYLAACALVLVATASAASPAAVTSAAPASGLKEVGRGHLSFLGFRIYEASLWSSDGRWSGFEPGQPLALALAYERHFSRAELIKITRGEFARLGLAAPEARSRWAGQLDGCWHDVHPGDTLTAVVVPGGETRFYDGSRLLGAIDDPAFGPAYLSIWLDPRSAVRDLRAQLLGLGKR